MRLIPCLTLSGTLIPIPAERLIFRPAAYAILLQDHKLLLVQMTATGKYHLPGGGVEISERIEETLHREVLEETGLQVRMDRLAFFEELFFYYDPSGRAYHGLHFYYHCTSLTSSLLTDDQVHDGSAECPRWVDLDSLKPEDFQHAGDKVLAVCKGEWIEPGSSF